MKNQHVRNVFAGTTRQTRLRIDEGLVKHPDERMLRTHDRSGQKLRDTVNPITGFCTGVTGPMESDGHTVRAAKPTSGAGTPLPTRDERTGLWWVGDDRLVIRTTRTPDGPLRRTRIVKSEDLDSRGRTPEERSATKRKHSARREANVTATRRTKADPITDEDIRKYLRRWKMDNMKLTSKIRSAARAAIQHERTVQAYGRDLRQPKGRR